METSQNKREREITYIVDADADGEARAQRGRRGTDLKGPKTCLFSGGRRGLNPRAKLRRAPDHKNPGCA